MIGILVHGRHLQTEGWEKLVWGEAPDILGAIPMMVLVVLNRGIKNVETIVFGTGASEQDGLKEAEYMKRFLLEHMEALGEFNQIRKHPNYDLAALKELFGGIICEITSQNTPQEIEAASKIFARASIDEVIHITSASHAPRCIRDAAAAFEQGLIMAGQVWALVCDQTAYKGTRASDVVVFEPPHRGDDPMTRAPIQAHEVFGKFFKVPGVAKKTEVLRAIDKILSDAQ